MRVFILLIIVSFPILQEDWKLEKNKDDIKVYTRKVENSPVKEFRVESRTSASLETIEKLFRDIPRYTAWMPDINEATILEMVSNDVYIYHMQINAPFPVSDRDLVTEMRMSHPEKNILRIDFNVLPDHIPEDDEFVRIRNFRGFWQFERKEDITLINNRFHSDPGGSVPSWVTNSFIARNPLETVTNLKEQVE